MKMRIATLAVAALLVANVSSSADARPFGMHGGFAQIGGWHGGWGHGGWGHRGWGWGGVGLGLATGALVGAALASPYYGYGYGPPTMIMAMILGTRSPPMIATTAMRLPSV
jgi:hypothetical protein